MTHRAPSTQQIARERSEAEASWRHITPQEIRNKLHALDNHPMRNVLGHFLATAIARHVPHQLGLIPPQWHPKPDA